MMRWNSSTGVSKIGVRPPAPALTRMVSMPPMKRAAASVTRCTSAAMVASPAAKSLRLGGRRAPGVEDQHQRLLGALGPPAALPAGLCLAAAQRGESAPVTEAERIADARRAGFYPLMLLLERMRPDRAPSGT